MYDDIAHSKENPIPGKVFNRPDGKDVYQGCKASYTGKDVSAEKLRKPTPPSKWIKTPLFYSQSTDLPVLRGRRCVDGGRERAQTGGL